MVASVTTAVPSRVTTSQPGGIVAKGDEDTLSYRIGYPVSAVLSILPQKDASGRTVGVFTPNRLTLGPGAIVLISTVNATIANPCV